MTVAYRRGYHFIEAQIYRAWLKTGDIYTLDALAVRWFIHRNVSALLVWFLHSLLRF